MKNTNVMNVAGGEIVLYQPDESIKLEVRLDAGLETVWLTQQQIASLFGVKQPAISKHLSNIFNEGELEKESVNSILEYTAADGKTYKVQYYNLDAIISVGYRVNSIGATAFRRWATGVLKDYLLKGYSVNQQLLAMQRQINSRFDEHSMRMMQIEDTQSRQQNQLDFFVRMNTPPVEMVFFNGEFFTARVAVESLIRTARKRTIIIDHYVDAKTFDMFDVRQKGVVGVIYTQGVGAGMIRLRDEHNRQIGVEPVEVLKWRVEPHDRFLIIDDRLYHCGHSLNATGSKLSAIMLMGTSPETILAEIR